MIKRRPRNIKSNRASFVLSILFLLLSPSIFSQDNGNDVSTQVWLDYDLRYNFENNFSVYGDLGWRIISPHVWTRYYIRPAVSYSRPFFGKEGSKVKSTWHFGVGLFYTDNMETPNLTELRPFQGYDVRWPNFKRLRFKHYFRLEERIEFRDHTTDFGMRARYLLGGTFSWEKEGWKAMNNFYLPFHFEFFFNLAKASQFNDVVRMTPGIGYTFNPTWRLEFNLSYHRVRNTVEEDFKTNDMVFRLRLYHRLF